MSVQEAQEAALTSVRAPASECSSIVLVRCVSAPGPVRSADSHTSHHCDARPLQPQIAAGRWRLGMCASAKKLCQHQVQDWRCGVNHNLSQQASADLQAARCQLGADERTRESTGPGGEESLSCASDVKVRRAAPEGLTQDDEALLPGGDANFLGDACAHGRQAGIRVHLHRHNLPR